MSARELALEYGRHLSGEYPEDKIDYPVGDGVIEWLLAKIREDRDEHGRTVEQFWQLFNPNEKYGPEKKEPTLLQAARAIYDNRLGHRLGNPTWGAPQHFWEELGQALRKHEEEE